MNNKFVLSANRTACMPRLLLAGLVAVSLSLGADAENVRPQTISLHKGWNSVFLEVSPTNREPSALFAQTPVAIAATYFAVEKPVQFIQDPGAIGWNKEGWGVWYADNRPDAFLSNLYAVHGNRAFLIFSTQDFVWTVTGTAELAPTRWKNDSFNLVGFGVDAVAPPTFEQFFSGSPAHHPYRIYRLVDGQWMAVTDAVRSTLRSGEAYWVYCNGASDYQGPLRAKIMAGRGIDFGDLSDAWISFANESSDPTRIRVETVGREAPLPLAYTIRGITKGNMLRVSSALPPSYWLPSLEAGESTSLWLKLPREKMTQPVQSTLLKITSDSGVQLWVPVTGRRDSLSAEQRLNSSQQF
jgi:hypothetical protein